MVSWDPFSYCALISRWCIDFMIPSFLWAVLDVGPYTSAWAMGGDLALDASVKAESVGKGSSLITTSLVV